MMNFFKSIQAKQPSSEENPLHNIFNNVQIHLTNFIRSHPNPFSSNPSELWARITDHLSNNMKTVADSRENSSVVVEDQCKKNLSEIKQRLNQIPVYRMIGSSQQHTPVMSKVGERSAVFYFFSEPDAEALLRMVNADEANREVGGVQLINVPLAEIIEDEGIEYARSQLPDTMSTWLVPDITEVKNALKERKKAGIHDESFSGVPVFQSDALRVMVDGCPNHRRPAFFKKADLKKALREVKELDQTNTVRQIQVTALEDIIQEMKDCSTSKWKDVVFIPPGNGKL